MKNVLEWLETSAMADEDKPIYCDRESRITFASVLELSRRIGTAFARKLSTNAPVAVFMERCVETPVGYFGVLYSGRAYAPIDAKLPKQRIQKILDTLQPEAILTQTHLKEELTQYMDEDSIYCYEDLIQGENDENCLQIIRRNMIATDPLCVIFTSGSSGTPKGVMLSHQSLMTYLCAYAKVMEIDAEDRIGNQSPLDYIAAIRDIYLPIMKGCQTWLIPKDYFMSPNNLFEYLNEHAITSVGWSVSAFTIASSLGAFSECKLKTLKKICFSGSVMPCKTLRHWQENLPEAHFVNQYGPTETTASCTYYEVDHLVEEDEVLPIGTAYDGYRVFLLKEDKTEAGINEEGEICVAGPGLTLGYYGDRERTDAAFVINPLETKYPQRMYKTGDIGVWRQDGLLEFHGRRDRQVKHMGHRVELDELEYAANRVAGVKESGSIYDFQKEKLMLFYEGEIDKKELAKELREVLPGFMVPRKVQQLEALPKLPNGKIDYSKLKENM
jgi:amino acid adenylation domain-containing protein